MKYALLVPIVTILSALALLVGAVISSNAGKHGYTMFSAEAKDIDRNGDGSISFGEYQEFHSEQLRWSFDALDANNDEAISADEWNAFLKMHGYGKGVEPDPEG